MAILSLVGILSILTPGILAQIGLTAQVFKLVGQQTPNNVKLSWHSGEKNVTWEVQRTLASAPDAYKTIASVHGHFYDDYDLVADKFTYRISGPSGQSNAFPITIADPAGTYVSYDDTARSVLKIKSRIKRDNTYYNYVAQGDKQGFNHFIEQSSTDGYTFTGETVVLTKAQVCAGSPDGNCRLEAVGFVQHPTTGEAIMWAHWENNKNYGRGEVAVGYGTPGADKLWTFGGSFRPMGVDSRDLSFFTDPADNAGYLLSAARSNTNLNIYALTSDWHNVTSLVSTVLKGERREAPSMIYSEGYFYLFSSTASGWYPSISKYISATSLAGPWTESRAVGNIATFGAQSGEVNKIGSTFVMRANRWAGQWIDKEPNNRQIVMPISLYKGYADFHFYETIEYFDDDVTGGVYGVQNGKIVSIDKKSVASGAAADNTGLAYANDGVATDIDGVFVSATVPFTYDIDLGGSHVISQVHLTTKMVPGSETAYQYVVQGSSDGKTWETIADQSTNTCVGFVTSKIGSTTPYSQVRLNVSKVINIFNKKEADWARGVHEFTVFASS